ncbi:MAG TPA: hypothetical protein VM581_00405 [Magnetospirillaceae bacterium]|nr:hypothetical protein [Magnetospirillaceae bacterium]
MGKATENSPEYYPWSHPDMLPHALASAGWGTRYPAIRYELGESDNFIPQEVIKQTLSQERFAVVIWQGTRVSFIDLMHVPERTFTSEEDPGRAETEWANIKRYSLTPDGPIFITIDENLDPRAIMPSIYALLATPMGVAPDAQLLVDASRPINRVLIEFPAYREDRKLPLSTTIGVLGGVATQEYINTIYGLPKV